MVSNGAGATVDGRRQGVGTHSPGSERKGLAGRGTAEDGQHGSSAAKGRPARPRDERVLMNCGGWRAKRARVSLADRREVGRSRGVGDRREPTGWCRRGSGGRRCGPGGSTGGERGRRWQEVSDVKGTGASLEEARDAQRRRWARRFRLRVRTGDGRVSQLLQARATGKARARGDALSESGPAGKGATKIGGFREISHELARGARVLRPRQAGCRGEGEATHPPRAGRTGRSRRCR